MPPKRRYRVTGHARLNEESALLLRRQQQAAETQLVQAFAVRFAALLIFAPKAGLSAALAALNGERQVALAALRERQAHERRQHQVVARARRSASRHGNTGAGLSQSFRRAAEALTQRPMATRPKPGAGQRAGIANRMHLRNPARGVKVIGRRDEGAKKIVPPSKEALRQLLAAADPDFRLRMIVASATGVRAGELHALRWKHIDFKRAELTVETRVDAYRDEDVTKTAAGMRTIPLGAAVVAALREWRQRSTHSGQEELIFPNRQGGYEAHDNMVKRRFLPLFKKLTEWHAEDPNHRPLPPARFNWHALRHFAVSCWIEAGLSPKTVQVFAGHASLQVTMDRYGHLFRSSDQCRIMDDMARELTS